MITSTIPCDVLNGFGVVISKSLLTLPTERQPERLLLDWFSHSITGKASAASWRLRLKTIVQIGHGKEARRGYVIGYDALKQVHLLAVYVSANDRQALVLRDLLAADLSGHFTRKREATMRGGLQVESVDLNTVDWQVRDELAYIPKRGGGGGGHGGEARYRASSTSGDDIYRPHEDRGDDEESVSATGSGYGHDGTEDGKKLAATALKAASGGGQLHIASE